MLYDDYVAKRREFLALLHKKYGRSYATYFPLMNMWCAVSEYNSQLSDMQLELNGG